MHAIRAAIHFTLGSSPGSLAFNKDMFLNIPLIADWHTITQRQENLTNENLTRKIKSIVNMTMSFNKGYSRKNENPCRLGKRTSGPYRVLQTHVNSTPTIELRPGVSETLSIRRVISYREPTVT
jgi:hypothetical protein